MAKTKKPRKRPLPIGKLALREGLAAKLSAEELRELEREVRVAVEKACTQAVEQAVMETYRRHWAVTMRVLVDRFGWGQTRISRLWDACLDYLRDIEDGRLTPQNILDTLEHDDGIRLEWEVK